MMAETSPFLNEQWKPLVGTDGGYIVSDMGRVQRVSRIGTPTKPLNPVLDRKGYHVYRVRMQGRVRRVKGHRVVLDAFVGPRPDLFGLHTNDIPGDNRLSNLRWGTRLDNAADWKANGRRHVEVPERTHCLRGHILNDENSRDMITRHGNICRTCRVCKRIARKLLAQKRAKEAI